MSKQTITIRMTHVLRSASLVVLVFLPINMISLAQGQRESNKRSPSNSEISHKGLRSTHGVKTVVRVHDDVNRSQIGSPQEANSAANASFPSGVICGVESRAAHA
jgi:hypothetical protein